GLAVQPPQVVRLEVGHADRAGPPVAVELLQGLPGRHEVAVVPRGQRPVDQEQVDVVGAERLQRYLECDPGVVGQVRVVAQLAGDEHIAAVKPGLRDGLADLLLVAVALRGVDVPVAGLQRRHHGLDRVLRLDLEDAEAELRDLLAVVQRDVRYRGHDRSHSSSDGRWPMGPTGNAARYGQNYTPKPSQPGGAALG